MADKGTVMKRVKFKTIFILSIAILFIDSCVPSGGNKTSRSSSKNNSINESTPTTNSQLPIPTSSNKDIFWSNSANVVSRATRLTVITSNLDILFLNGGGLSNYLAGVLDGSTQKVSEQSFCIAIRFSGINEELRVKASVVETQADQFPGDNVDTAIRSFQVDLANSSMNNSSCSSLNSPFAPRYSPSELCTTCDGVILSSTIQIFINNNTADNKKISSDSLFLNLDYQSTTTNNPGESGLPTNTCTNSSCKALGQGYDCCIGGTQCAVDLSIKEEYKDEFQCWDTYNNSGSSLVNCPGGSKAQYNIIESAYGAMFTKVQQNASYKLDYEQYYNICPNIAHIPVNTESEEDLNQVDAANFELQKNKYLCLQGYESTPQDLSKCCDTGTCTSTDYTSTLLQVWRDCGCDASPFPTDVSEESQAKCSFLTLIATKDSNQNIISVKCSAPNINEEVPPFEERNVSVPSRSVPHILFGVDASGENTERFDTLDNMRVANKTQEGVAFSYLDANKTIPLSQNEANMNQVLGSMSVDLSGSRPAKVIKGLEIGQSYIVMATTGYLTPCPECSNDSWFDNFYSHPPTSNGIGLTAYGYTTNRNQNSTNITQGNYEDTIFGRACWLPPTMIPYSHQQKDTPEEQRRSRLKTQASFYVNGYQRDWWGFNKGALIGSFNGVNWFAIGKARRIVATSKRLYLALNNPLGDLADPTTHGAYIVVDAGVESAALFDFNPELDLEHPEQNQAASCQYYHQCEVDSDCITKLGWEYMCADVTNMQTQWPVFDEDANELKNPGSGDQKITVGSILAAGFNGTPKRCVYRGRGAICSPNYGNISNTILRKNLTCAPNFYCQKLTSSTNPVSKFNSELARLSTNVGTILFGQEADVLGRPKNYIQANKALPNEAIENIAQNFSHLGFTSDTIGFCTPGRQLGLSSQLQSHQSEETLGRTDYISQIGGCDSGATGDARVYTCPLIDDDGNYVLNDITFTNDQKQKLHRQNSCGGESVSTYTAENTFAEIEADRIFSISYLNTPTLARDACLRRPGSVCQTDLDCSVSSLHKDIADGNNDLDFFGGTFAERNYWREKLICGQSQENPSLNAPSFDSFDMTKNKCCMPLGNELTMYTEFRRLTGDPEFIKGQKDEDRILDVNLFSFLDPNGVGRYSRYSIVYPLGVPTGYSSTDFTVPYNEEPKLERGSTPTKLKTPRPFQWKTFHDTGKKTCCGGGWIRQFSDGGHDWKVTNRLQIPIRSFQCLGYLSEDSLELQTGITKPNFDMYHNLGLSCADPVNGGCSQVEMGNSEENIVLPQDINDMIPGTVDNDGNVTLDMSDFDDEKGQFKLTNPLAPSSLITPPLPRFYATLKEYSENWPAYPVFIPTGDIQDTTENEEGCVGRGRGICDTIGVSYYLPPYINRDNLIEVEITFKGGKNDDKQVRVIRSGNLKSFCQVQRNDDCAPLYQPGSNAVVNDMKTVIYNPACILGNSELGTLPENVTQTGDTDASGACIQNHTSGDILHIKALLRNDPTVSTESTGTSTDVEDWSSARIKIKFKPMTVGLYPGNDLYYLTKLGRLELLGIPQIYYEPLYCATRPDKLIEGIFKETTRSAIEPVAANYVSSTFGGRSLGQIYEPKNNQIAAGKDISNPQQKIVYQDQISIDPIFSPDKFNCCVELGKTTSDPDKCCSQYAIPTESTNLYKCMLPTGTDMHVYFNKFVSSEGTNEEITDGKLEDEDFIPETGELKNTNTVKNKLISLGSVYCPTGVVRTGGIAGPYLPEPTTTSDFKMWLFADSQYDYDDKNEFGAANYDIGFKWNHHYYCGQ